MTITTVCARLAASLLIVILALAPGACSRASDAMTSPNTSINHGGVFFRTVTVGTQEHKYAVYSPPGHGDGSAYPNPPAPLPLVVFLNGSGECGTDGTRQLTQGLLPAVLNNPAAWPMVIAFPQKPEPDSEWEDHDALVMACIADAKAHWSIDPTRIYLTGLSQGGHGTWMIAAKHPDLFAAIAPVCGYGPGGYRVPPDPSSVSAIARQLRNTPVNAFHGALDDVVPAQQTQMMVAAILAEQRNAQPQSNDPASPLRITVYPDLNHGCWDRAYRDGGIAQWLLRFSRE